METLMIECWTCEVFALAIPHFMLPTWYPSKTSLINVVLFQVCKNGSRETGNHVSTNGRIPLIEHPIDPPPPHYQCHNISTNNIPTAALSLHLNNTMWPVLHAKNLRRKTPQVSYCQGQSTLIYQTGAECTWWQWPSFKCGAGKTEGSENIMAAAGKTSRRSIIAASDPNNSRYKYLWI